MIRIATFAAAAALAVAGGACKKDDAHSSAPAPVAQEAPATPVAQAPATPEAAAKPDATVQTVTPDQVASLIASKGCDLFDANSAKTRAEFGKIPTAVLLQGGSDYDLSQLPTDKSRKLVFYCANTHCGASHKSAAKAVAAGYTDVSVMPQGVMGWKKSGHKTEKVM